MNNLLPEKDADAVLEILSNELGVDRKQLTPDTRIADLNPDSLTQIEINMALEDYFNISIPDERLEQVQTVGDIFELLAEMLQPPGRR